MNAKTKDGGERKKWEFNKEGIPFAICPKCHSKIYGIIEIETSYIVYKFSPDKINIDDKFVWGSRYKCPECGKIIAKSMGEIVALFQEPKLNAKKG